MSSNNLFSLFLIIVLITSCSKDDPSIMDDNNFNTEENSGYILQNEFVSTDYVYLEETDISFNFYMANKEINNNCQEGNLNIVIFEISKQIIGNFLFTNTYNIDPNQFAYFILKYDVTENTTPDNCTLTITDEILNSFSPDFKAESFSIEINSFHQTDIDFTFSFQRADGEVILGGHNGPLRSF